MAFTTEPTITSTGIETMVVILKTNPLDPDEQQSAHFWLMVRRSDGSTKKISGDLVPHITVAQRDGLLAFMANLRDQAIAQVLP